MEEHLGAGRFNAGRLPRAQSHPSIVRLCRPGRARRWVRGWREPAHLNAGETGMFDWFALYVQSRHEKAVAQALAARGFESCLPLTRTLRDWSDRRVVVEEPVFPGYVFCKFDSNVRTPILRTTGVVRILGVGKELVPLEKEELGALQVLERTKVPVEQWPFVGEGDRVRIEGGPLDGLAGVVTKCKGGLRVLVSVFLLQRSVAVEVGRCRIRRTDSSPARKSPTAAPLAAGRGYLAARGVAAHRLLWVGNSGSV